MSIQNDQYEKRQRRWRLLLGKDADQLPAPEGQDKQLDQLLQKLYRSEEGYNGGNGQSMPNAAKWLADVKTLFPASAVTIIQKDAIQRLNIAALLQDEGFMAEVKADVHLVAQLMMLKDHIPDQARENARKLVNQLVQELLKRYQAPMEQSLRGALNRASRNNRPRAGEINWNATVRKNLATWQPEQKIIFPERLIGYGRRQRRCKEVILCVDQSGSMANSVIFSTIFAAVMASMPAIKLKLVVFDTAVVDLTEQLQDPVELLFGVQLGGGTDINKAMQYCESLIQTPSETHLVLISDLYEGGNAQQLLQTAQRMVGSGVNLITLLALANDGAPYFDKRMAADFAALGSPAFACTPDLFPELMAAALERKDMHQFASQRGIPVTPASKPD
ncbi:VWA domain-containing protein [Parathalassolituus penaei]|uniref:VWA domain-containing protein n=1 Tax=Parathalassolituus penaei TaxID=2997323 RepID=A0A9X3IRG6_9GAMM|nr:VWA domain-containing protein [Parathalassolituus penaei]MCY0964866.1 VWA domain-containing protein [Parathalassolituus penaei]